MAPRRADVPARIAWAVDRLDLAPADHVLEFGCGPGVAASLVADRVPRGAVLAIDRSAVAVARTAARTATHIEDGRVEIAHIALAELQTDRVFDVAFGINVNLFWTGTADAESRVLSDVVAPDGVVHLVYEIPGDPDRELAVRAAAGLGRHGFVTTITRGPGGRLLCISGHRPPPPPPR